MVESFAVPAADTDVDAARSARRMMSVLMTASVPVYDAFVVLSQLDSDGVKWQAAIVIIVKKTFVQQMNIEGPERSTPSTFLSRWARPRVRRREACSPTIG